MVVTFCARSAVAVSVPAEASSSVEADDTVSTISPTAASKESASLTISALRCCAAILSCLILASASSRAFCSETTLNFSTAPATAFVLAAKSGQHDGKIAPGEFVHRHAQRAH